MVAAIPRTKSHPLALPLMVAVSVTLHWTLVRALPQSRPTIRRVETVEMELAKPAAKPIAPPAPRVEEPAPKPVLRIARAEPKVVPPPSAPPPPNARPAAEAKPTLIKVGLSLGSTVEGGGFAVGIGNTLYGKADERVDPKTIGALPAGGVQAPAASSRFVPATRTSEQPRILEQPKVAYPPQARQEGVEGRVVLLLRIDAQGRVVAVRILEGPGHGLDEAAAGAAHRFRFSPASAEGEPVSTEIRFTYTFLLE